MASVEVSPWEAGQRPGDLSGRAFVRLNGTLELVRMAGRGCALGHRRSAGAVERYPFHVRPIRFTRRGSSAHPQMIVNTRELFRIHVRGKAREITLYVSYCQLI